MESLLAYIVQVNILLAMVYGGYILLLKNLTFYQLNRLYFLSGAFFAFGYPFLDIKSLFQRHIEPVGELIGFLPDFYLVEEKSIYTLANLLYLIIALGMITLVVKFLMQLASLFRIHVHSVEATWQKYLYRNVLFPVVPFSFLNKIYLNKQQHAEPELHDIFEHESIHVKGLHSVDIIVFEILLIACWYNPFVWLMRRATRQNLEFLTDQQVLNKGIDRQTYQYSLLNVSKQGASVGISNQFNFKLLKKRIMMMNKKRSSKLELSKYAFLLPIIIFSAGAFTVSKADPAITEAVNVVEEISLTKLDMPQVFGLKNESRLLADTLSMQSKVWQLQDTAENEEALVGRELSSADHPVKGIVLADTTKGKRAIALVPDVNAFPPLFYIDDKAMDARYDIKKINPNDIHAVEVIKGAGATGSDPALKNGIIKIFTKEAAGEGYIGVNGSAFYPTKGDTSNVNNSELIIVKGAKIGANDSKGFMFKSKKSLGKEPLIVVDGVVAADQSMSDINPDAIESISILKDKSAKLFYGASGANGVILVTTKANAAKTGANTIQNSGSSTEKGTVVVKGRELKKVVVTGRGLKDNTHTNQQLYNFESPSSLKQFLDANRANIDMKSDVVLVINGKVAREIDLKKIKAADVSQVGAVELTAENSNLPKNMVGLLLLNEGASGTNRGASASVYNAKKKIELVVNPDKKDMPYLERK